MAKFVTIVDGSATLHINVDQIAYMRQGAGGQSTIIVFAGTKDHTLAVKQPPASIIQAAKH
jgi:hypothetical protein